MARYICCKCGAKFDNPFRDGHGAEAWDSCPECGCADFEAAWKCVCCGEDFQFGDLADGKLCKTCLSEAPSMDDVAAFAYDEQNRDAFASFLVEKYEAIWKERRLAPFRREG